MQFRNASCYQIFGIAAIQNTEIGIEAQITRIAAQDHIAHVMECSAPQLPQIDLCEQCNAVQHFSRCFICEGKKEDLGRIDPRFEQPGYAISNRSRLTAARASNNQNGAISADHNLQLLRI